MSLVLIPRGVTICLLLLLSYSSSFGFESSTFFSFFVFLIFLFFIISFRVLHHLIVLLLSTRLSVQPPNSEKNK